MAERKTNMPRLNVDESLDTGSSSTVNIDGSVGFFGATAVGQQNVPQTSPTVADIITALVALGLVEQSD